MKVEVRISEKRGDEVGFAIVKLGTQRRSNVGRERDDAGAVDRNRGQGIRIGARESIPNLGIGVRESIPNLTDIRVRRNLPHATPGPH